MTQPRPAQTPNKAAAPIAGWHIQFRLPGQRHWPYVAQFSALGVSKPSP